MSKLLRDLVKEYALQGYQDWKSADSTIIQRARSCLMNRVVETEYEVRSEVEKPSFGKFLPMPTFVYRKCIERCFFRMETIGDKEINCRTFELFVLLDMENSLAFRFEPADDPTYNHNYAHVQFCRKVYRKGICPHGIPDWLPVNYPAFPLPSSDPLKLFLSMALSVHGRSAGLEKLLVKIFQKASSPNKARQYINVIEQMSSRVD